jgi:hypothetical protein
MNKTDFFALLIPKGLLSPIGTIGSLDSAP